MCPVLFHLGSFPVPAYGFFLLVAFFSCWALSRAVARSEGFDPRLVTEGGLEFIVAALIGAHLTHVVLDWHIYAQRPELLLRPAAIPLAFQGGLLAAVLTALWFCRRRGVRFTQFADVAAPSLGLGLALARVGCFLAGCCHGAPSTLPWAVTFPMHAGARHPVQFYELVLDLGIMAFLLWYRTRRRFEGEVFALFLVLYGAVRFGCEMIRVDTPQNLWLGLSWPQAAALASMALGAAWIAWGRRDISTRREKSK